MIKSLENYFKDEPTEKEIFLYNNKSLYFILISEILKSLNIQYTIIDNFERPKSNYHLLLYPFFEFRVFNVNFYRTLDQEFGEPYFIYFKSNRTQLIEVDFAKKGINSSFNLMDLIPEFLNSYLLDSHFLQWIHQKSCPHPHNDFFDKARVLQMIETINKNFNYNFELNGNPYKETLALINLKDVKRQDYPLHRYYEKYLGMNLKINEFEKSIYGC